MCSFSLGTQRRPKVGVGLSQLKQYSIGVVTQVPREGWGCLPLGAPPASALCQNSLCGLLMARGRHICHTWWETQATGDRLVIWLLFNKCNLHFVFYISRSTQCLLSTPVREPREYDFWAQRGWWLFWACFKDNAVISSVFNNSLRLSNGGQSRGQIWTQVSLHL